MFFTFGTNVGTNWVTLLSSNVKKFCNLIYCLHKLKQWRAIDLDADIFFIFTQILRTKVSQENI